jgi:hypothetical protein
MKTLWIVRVMAALALMALVGACSSSKPQRASAGSGSTASSTGSSAGSNGGSSGGQMKITFNVTGALSINGDVAVPTNDCLQDPERRDLVDGKDTWVLPNGKATPAETLALDGHEVGFSVVLKPFHGPGAYDQSSIDGSPYPFLLADGKQVGFGTSASGGTSSTKDSAILRSDGSGSLTLSGALNGTVSWTCRHS